ncbi:hypothetical protein GCM10023220_20490 [Streptomyces ziwulingensis]|uniref:Membrane dipeptidase n=2 Tax=Streptomyces ziwulingensis TaxID=1045501 RepID=A0ABP9BEB8_9ACTN
MAVAARPPRRWASFFRDRWLPQLRAGGVRLQVLPVFVDDEYRPEGALRQTLRMIECAHPLAEGNADAEMERLVDHILHLVRVIGSDHVGLGPDFIKEVDQDLVRSCCEDEGDALELALPGLDGPSGLPLLTRALVGRGVAENTVLKVLGGNVLGLLRTELGRPA